MENRGNRTGEELASTKTQFRGHRSSAQSDRAAERQSIAPPVVTFELEKEIYFAGDFLTCQYEVELLDAHDVQAIETSVVWLTRGKGDEDIGVHFFERRDNRLLSSDTFKTPQRISTVLPASPLSYDGQILKVQWFVRVRLFLAGGEQVTSDGHFRLGDVVAVQLED